MREYKFRGKRVSNEEWVYGFYFEGFTGIPYILVLHDHILRMTEYYEVIPETVGQYVRLKERRKDNRENRELYEGDVVCCYGGEYCQGYYEFNQKIIIKDMIIDCFMMGENEYVELLGNTHDNPELKDVSRQYNHRSRNIVKDLFSEMA